MGKKTLKDAKKKVIIYQAKNGAIELRGDFTRETIWATLDQIAEVFGRDKSVISRHLTNIYKYFCLVCNTSRQEVLLTNQ
jgi:hypothetical protein